MIRSTGAVLVCAGTLALGSAAGAQSARTFKARLSPVPIDVTMQATISGSGSVSAALTGTKLTITGTYDGLKSPATTVQMHKSPVRGVRGPVVVDLYGNGVSPAVATYSLDALGSLYEEHSPQTELPRLGSPKT